MTTDKEIAAARAALDAAMLEWGEAKAFLTEVQAAETCQPPTGGSPLQPPGGIVSLNRAGGLLQTALRRERRAQQAWVTALQRLQNLVARAGANITGPEERYIRLRRCIDERSYLIQTIAIHLLHGTPAPRALILAYDKACAAERCAAFTGSDLPFASQDQPPE